MAHVVYTAIANGQSADGDILDAIHDAFAAQINGNLDATNWAAGQVFSLHKVTGQGAVGGQVPVWSSANSRWEGSTLGYCLGARTYDPTTVASPSTTSTTLVALDTTNLRLTVNVRRSSATLLFLVDYTLNVGPTSHYIGILEATTTIADKKSQRTGTSNRQLMMLLKTGVAAGSHVYDLAQRSLSGATTVSVSYGTQASPATTDPGPISFAVFECAAD